MEYYMRQDQKTSTGQFDFKFNNHCFGGCAFAAVKIANGDTVKFDVFKRLNKEDCRELTYQTSFYFGLLVIEGTPAFRVSPNTDLEAPQSHSLIASWNNEANNPIYIAARLTLFLTREGSDWFLDDNI